LSVTLKQLEIFNAVVVAGSISRAARRLELSQPTISQQLAKMEAELGTPLMVRKGTTSVELTPAGEYWYRRSADVLTEMAAISAQHDQRFGRARPALHFGTTPPLRGRFLGALARLAVADGQFSRFDFHLAVNSVDIVELVHLHQLNCALVSEASVEGHRGSLNVTPLFDDGMAWAIPKAIPEAVVHQALVTAAITPPEYDALLRYVQVRASPWHEISQDWYRSHLPGAEPFFSCQSHTAAIDIVAAGLATCHGPLSLFLNLPQSTLDNLRLYELEGISRRMVLIMPRHLVSLAPFAAFKVRLQEFMARHYSKELALEGVADMPGANGVRPVRQPAEPALGSAPAGAGANGGLK
jgi:DNA-binding transcriptional LysR family regulator